VVDLLPLVVVNRSPFTPRFCAFLTSGTQATRISADQWNSFLEFSATVGRQLQG
jgi:hypothetical protein